MDPDICLRDIRALVEHADDVDDPLMEHYSFHQLVDLVEGLDAWMSKGAYPPSAWRRSAKPQDCEPQADLEPGQGEAAALGSADVW